MRHLKVIFVLTAILFFADCDKINKQDVCNVIQFADLFLKDILPELQSQDSNSAVVQVSQFIVNTADNLVCKDSSKPCDQKIKASSDDTPEETNIFYSPNSPTPFDWGTAVKTVDMLLNKIDPCSQATISDQFKFNKDGYYLIRGLVNLTSILISGKEYQPTSESDTTNNKLQKEYSPRSTVVVSNNFEYIYVKGGVVIHISGLKDGGAATPTVTLLSRKVTYQ